MSKRKINEISKTEEEKEAERIHSLDDTKLFKEFEDGIWNIVFNSTMLDEDETGLVPYLKELKKRFPQFKSGDEEEDEEECAQ